MSDGANIGGGGTGRRYGRFHGRVDGHDRCCEHPDCMEPGEFRAPRHRHGGSDEGGAHRWRWLCLDHVRAFNAGYDYFDGMNADDIERAQHVYGGWERETRAFAVNGDPEPAWARFTDPADILGARFARASTQPPVSRNGQLLSVEDRKALKILGLKPDSTLSDVRRAYTEKVRLYHPDKNGGDRSHERALQAAISAYTHLRKAPAFS